MSGRAGWLPQTDVAWAKMWSSFVFLVAQRHYRCEPRDQLVVLGQGCRIRVLAAVQTCSKTCLKLRGAQESHSQEDHIITGTGEVFVHQRRQQSTKKPAPPSSKQTRGCMSGAEFPSAGTRIPVASGEVLQRWDPGEHLGS